MRDHPTSGRAHGERLCIRRGRLTPRDTDSSEKPLPDHHEAYDHPTNRSPEHPTGQPKNLPPRLLTNKEDSIGTASRFGEVAAIFETPFTVLVGCRAPIQLAVMGGGTGTPELAAAVSEAGGLGMISSTFPLQVSEQLSWVQGQTDQPVGVGFFAFDLRSMTKELELAATSARVVDMFWGEPDPVVVNRIHAGGALAFWQVGSLDEALTAADAGCDVVVAQGVEAGGHVRGTTPLLRLLAQVVPAVNVPVVAAGGIATGAALAAALNAGAAGARVGTRFLASAESGAHPEYVAALLAAGAEDTVRTTAFGEGWSDAPHRVLRAATAARRPCKRRRRTGGVWRPELGDRSLVQPATDSIHNGRRNGHGHVRRLWCG